MLGFVIGTLCLIALVMVVRHGRRYPHRYRPGYGHGLRWLSWRLDAMPGQEKAIRAAVDEFLDATAGLRGELAAARRDVSASLQGERFDAALAASVFDRQQATLTKVREAAVVALGKVHEALDDRQRARLADLLASGHPGWGLYRGHCC